MGKQRSVRKIVTGSTQYDGAGVKLVRVIGHADTGDFDPFLMLDAFDSRNPEDYVKGFPWHPHRGIETVTYLIRGDIEHGDSLGNKGSILDGSCQWMTAGGGIIHQEMPKPSEWMLGVQLWLNLPRRDKMTRPQYRDIRPEMIPEVEEAGSTTRVLSGTYRGTAGAAQGDYVAMTFLDVRLEPGAQWRTATPPAHTVFAYIVAGSGSFEGKRSGPVPSHRAVLFGDGEELSVGAADDGMRFLLFSGAPLREPVAWGGPIVMNTRDELELAFRQLREGTFIQK